METHPVEMGWQQLAQQCLVDEDEAIIALNKPAGIAVTGERHDTDLVELAAAEGITLYPVHRIDKVTSGLVLFAKDLTAHGGLTRQFTKRTADKRYLVVTAATDLPDTGVIDLPLSVGRKNRVRIAAPRDTIRREGQLWTVDEGDLLAGKNYPSRTEFTTVARTDRHTILLARPVTGRRHQIRVHLAWIGYPIAGDPLFDKSGEYARTHLHSLSLRVEAPWRADSELALTATPGADFFSTGSQPILENPADLLEQIIAE
ncbi:MULTISPECIES: RluA family pseudouridine synthase [Nocardia]|uniref:RluA family pseudouridine synthase n=1 Tax=Nocardia TaxID=1817 RepID=UPI001E601493|nr:MULTISPECIES: RNA pseudouridine synthase [Nocardia]